MKPTTVVLWVATVAISTAKARTKNSEKLQILSITPNEVKALYRTGSDEGIELLSEVRGESHHVSISTLHGIHLVSARSSLDAGTGVLKIMDSMLLLHPSGGQGERARVMEYAVPVSAAAHFEKELRDRDYISADLLRTLDTSDTARVKHSAFSKLLSRPEFDTIIEMAHAMGTAGIFGHKNQPALNFYGLTMTYGKMRKLASIEDPAPLPNKNLRDSSGTFKTCTLEGWLGEYKERLCKRCPFGSGCWGMCGASCNCWSFACGNCCYYQGCYEHDKCCNGKMSYLDKRCIMVLPFNCKHYQYKC